MSAIQPVGDPPARTFTENARRAQIVRSAIETIAEVGYAHASFAKIAKRAGLSSTGLISYHFAGKDELIGQVVTEVITEISQFMAERVGAQTSAAGRLRAYIAGNIEFIGSHRVPMKALLSIFLSGGMHYDADDDRAVTTHLEQILQGGQQSGEFRDFDTRVMSTTIQRAVDGVPFVLESTPDLDLPTYAAELATTFELATRRAT